MKLWGGMNYNICNGCLNIANSIIKVAGGVEGNANAGQKQLLSRSKARALKKAKIVPKTFKDVDLANKALVIKHGKRVASLTCEVTKDDGESGKGIESSTLNAAAKLNNDMKLQKMKMHEWAMIKEALELGVSLSKLLRVELTFSFPFSFFSLQVYTTLVLRLGAQHQPPLGWLQ
jgi:hypothetical protein